MEFKKLLDDRVEQKIRMIRLDLENVKEEIDYRRKICIYPEVKKRLNDLYIFCDEATDALYRMTINSNYRSENNDGVVPQIQTQDLE